MVDFSLVSPRLAAVFRQPSFLLLTYDMEHRGKAKDDYPSGDCLSSHQFHARGRMDDLADGKNGPAPLGRKTADLAASADD